MSKIIICIDGLGKDFISEKDTPFLYDYSKKNSFFELETLFATTGIENCFFTGRTPKESNIWLEFIKKDNSVFDNFLLRFFRGKLRDYFGAFLQLLRKRTWISGTHNIPLSKIKYFDSVIKDNIWKLNYFKDKSFSFYKWPFHVIKDKEKIKIVFRYEDDRERLGRLLSPKNKDIYYTQLMGIDKVVHKYGKRSLETKKALKRIDDLMKYFVERYGDEEIIIWSDHGFCDIKKYINLFKILPKRQDYLYFIAGTTAHFWFENNEVKEEILKSVEGIKEIKVLDEEKADGFDINIDRKYGDLVIYVEKTNFFFPNFYQKNLNERFVSMHSYPNDKELNGFLVTNKDVNRNNKTLKMKEAINILQ